MQLRFLDFWGKNHPFFKKAVRKIITLLYKNLIFCVHFPRLSAKITRVFKPLITLICTNFCDCFKPLITQICTDFWIVLNRELHFCSVPSPLYLPLFQEGAWFA